MKSAVVLMTLLMLVACHVEGAPYLDISSLIKDNSRRHFCGSRLADMMSMLCLQGYNYNPQLEDDNFKKIRQRRQIVDLCCKQPCTIRDLKEYCAPF